MNGDIIKSKQMKQNAKQSVASSLKTINNPPFRTFWQRAPIAIFLEMNGFQEIENIYSAANFKGALVSKDHFPSFSKRDKMFIFPLLSLQMLVCWDKTASDVLISRMAGTARHSLSEYFRRQRNSPSWLFPNICLH